MSVQGLVVKRSERSRWCRFQPVYASSRGQSSQLTLSSAQRGQREERESFHVCKHRACVYHHSLPRFHGDCVPFYLRYLNPRYFSRDLIPDFSGQRKKKGKSAERDTRSDHERTVSPGRGDP